MYFDGSTYYTFSGTWPSNEPLMLGAWVRDADADVNFDRGLLSMHNTDMALGGFALFLRNTAAGFSFRTMSTAGGLATALSGGLGVLHGPTKWYSVMGMTLATNDRRCAHNANTYGTNTTVANGSATISPEKRIGRGPGALGNYHTGDLCHLALWNVSTLSGSLDSLRNAWFAGIPPLEIPECESLISYLPFLSDLRCRIQDIDAVLAAGTQTESSSHPPMSDRWAA